MTDREEQARRLRKDWQQRSRQLAKQGHGRTTLAHRMRKDPNALADEALSNLSETAVDALIRCYRADSIRADEVSDGDLAALRKAYFLRRWEDPETGERSRERFECATAGAWAAKRLIEGKAKR